MDKKRGFAGLHKERLREISRKGGLSVPADKRTFSTDRDLAASAGRKGGDATARVRGLDPSDWASRRRATASARAEQQRAAARDERQQNRIATLDDHAAPRQVRFSDPPMIAPHLPYLRRYARALTGSLEVGDQYVRLTMEPLVTGRLPIDFKCSLRVNLYRTFDSAWRSSGSRTGETTDPELGPKGRYQAVSCISARARPAFLLHQLEGFTVHETGLVLNIPEHEAQTLIDEAEREVNAALATDVLIIEDEPMMAADIAALATELGHTVVAIATTKAEALAAVSAVAPGLLLADICLADGFTGIDAVKDILQRYDVPVIFITAFPERLLTGERPEPTFLITKPFEPEPLKAAIRQALFFHPRKARASA